MKKLVTLLLLILLGYNSIGYYIIYHFQQILAQKEITDYINRGEFLDTELTLFKLPVQEYYEMTSKDFSRVTGDFVYNGKFYERVKEKLENDTMYIYCLNDEKQELLLRQLSAHVQDNLVEEKTSKPNKSTKLIKNLLKEYLPKKTICVGRNLADIEIKEFKDTHNLLFVSIVQSIPSPPPKVS